MNKNYLHDQRGVAMLLELVLVAAVLGLIGVAVYQTHHNNASSVSVASTPAPVAVTGTSKLLGDTAATVTADSASETALSASAEQATGDVSSSDSDVANLGATLNANSF